MEFFQILESEHRNAAEGILQSIIDDRDGKSPESAFVVITISEEYWVLFALGLNVVSRFTDHDRELDIFAVSTSEGEETQIYFDCSKIFDAVDRLEEGKKG